MRTIMLLFLMASLGCNNDPPTSVVKDGHKEILLYFIKDKAITLRPGQITEAEFWGSSGSLDTLKIQDSIREYSSRFNSLQDTTLYSPAEVDLFPHVFAFVFEGDKGSDTIYANRVLKLFEWKGRNKFYKDTTSFFIDKFYTLSNVN